ncbi:hypothetical protein L5515_006403 [Caenorhabditis briggsae]|uniref:Uncharacterized protein n=1 Tax=Caenorhabditis briggsae TaxID=6238 RepID=A0AAE9F1I4_CAEBR|nr:hypothetical protein L5515_006403 [Caenorhabditis briggsae]
MDSDDVEDFLDGAVDKDGLDLKENRRRMVVLYETPPIFIGKFGGSMVETSSVLLSQKSRYVKRRTYEDDEEKLFRTVIIVSEDDDKRQVIFNVLRLIL